MEQIKTLLKWIGGPFLALGAAVFFLMQKNNTLKDQLKNEQAERLQDQLRAELKEAEKDAQAKEAAYIAAANELFPDRASGNKLPGSDQ